MLYRLRKLRSRAATAENPMALAGGGGRAADGLKGSPALKDFREGEKAGLLDTAGPGMVRRIWCTSHARRPAHLRNLILRMYWEGAARPSVEVPLGDFFGVAHGQAVPMYSAMVSMQEGRGFNSLIPMPFSEHARITLENATGEDIDWFFYEVDFTLGDEVGEEDGRFHAAFRRENPCPMGRDFTIFETEGGRGVFLGCVLGVRPLREGWWGEGEVKIYLDDDEAYPTICGTGTEDYIGSAWGLGEHCTLWQGAPLNRGGLVSLYRFHGPDPVYFERRIKVAVQQMGGGLRSELERELGEALVFSPKNHPRRSPEDGFYLRSDDWSALAYWYQYPLCEASSLLEVEERTRDLPDEALCEGVLADL